jgi:hypothetical protein
MSRANRRAGIGLGLRAFKLCADPSDTGGRCLRAGRGCSPKIWRRSSDVVSNGKLSTFRLMRPPTSGGPCCIDIPQPAECTQARPRTTRTRGMHRPRPELSSALLRRRARKKRKRKEKAALCPVCLFLSLHVTVNSRIARQRPLRAEPATLSLFDAVQAWRCGAIRAAAPPRQWAL